MSDEIYINTGTSFQQPFNQRNPAQGTQPATAQRVAQQPAIAQQPATYQNRSPFTYRNPANSQQPYIANAQQPYPYIANAQNPYIANAQQPYPYIANARQPYPYIANAQTPYIANAQQPYPYIADARQPYIANGQQPYPYIADARQPYIANGQQPYPYIANGQQPYIANAQQPYPYIANAQQPYNHGQPSTYSRTGTGQAVSYTETLSTVDNITVPSHGDNHIRTENAISNQRSFEVTDTRLQYKMTISTYTSLGTSYTQFDLDVQMMNYFGDSVDGFVGVSGSPSSISLPSNGTYRDVFTYVFPTSSAPTSFAIEETDSIVVTKSCGTSTCGVTDSWTQTGSGTTYGLTEGTFATVSSDTFGIVYQTLHSRSGGASTSGTGSNAFDVKFRRSGFPDLASEEIHVCQQFEHTYTGGGGGPL